GKYSQRGPSFARVAGREESEPLSLRWDENICKIGLTAQHLGEPSFGSDARLSRQRRLQPVAIHQQYRGGTQRRERQRCPQCERARALARYRTRESDRAELGEADSRREAIEGNAKAAVALAHPSSL